MLNNVMVVLL